MEVGIGGGENMICQRLNYKKATTVDWKILPEDMEPPITTSIERARVVERVV